MRYRPEIDGVRALAVLAVVAYHAGVPGLDGGFVGVDVFFVISGFLITGLLAREVERSGRLSVAGFYGRRARRLLPVAALVTVVTVAVGWVVLSPLSHRDLANDALATSTYTINLRLAAQQLDYLRSSLAPSAFQQFWSLAVEEQFYLVWPLVLVVALRGSRPRRRAASVVGAVCVASLAASLVLTRSSPPWAFFSLGARAWQLGAGALLALGWSTVEDRVDERAREAGRVVGLGLIVASMVGFSASTPWPGSWALVPTVGTLLVLAGPPATPGRSSPAAMLSMGPATWVGVRSYSWYLWHWPAMVFAAAVADRALGGWPAVAAAVGSLFLAHLTYRWVEQPVREAPRLVGSPRRSVALGVSATVALACVFGVLAARQVDLVGPGGPVAAPTPLAFSPGRLDRAARTEEVPVNLTPSLGEAHADAPVVFADGCNGDLGATPVSGATVDRCTYGDTEAGTTVVLFGDSHAAQWVPALAALGRAQQFRLVSLTKSGCPAADLTVRNRLLGRTYTECDEWRRGVVSLLGDLRPDLTIVTNSSHYDAQGRDGSAADGNDWVGAIEGTLRAVSRSSPAVLLGDTPYPVDDVPDCLSRNLSTATRCVLERGRLYFGFARVEAQAASDAGVPLVPTVDLVCGPQRCPVVVGRVLVYRDDSHLTTVYAERAARGLGDLLAPAAARAGAPGVVGPG